MRPNELQEITVSCGSAGNCKKQRVVRSSEIEMYNVWGDYSFRFIMNEWWMMCNCRCKLVCGSDIFVCLVKEKESLITLDVEDDHQP